MESPKPVGDVTGAFGRALSGFKGVDCYGYYGIKKLTTKGKAKGPRVLVIGEKQIVMVEMTGKVKRHLNLNNIAYIRTRENMGVVEIALIPKDNVGEQLMHVQLCTFGEPHPPRSSELIKVMLARSFICGGAPVVQIAAPKEPIKIPVPVKPPNMQGISHVEIHKNSPTERLGLTLSKYLIVESTEAGSPSERAGINRFVGHKVVALEGHKVSSTDEIRKVMEEYQNNTKLSVLISDEPLVNPDQEQHNPNNASITETDDDPLLAVMHTNNETPLVSHTQQPVQKKENNPNLVIKSPAISVLSDVGRLAPVPRQLESKKKEYSPETYQLQKTIQEQSMQIQQLLNHSRKQQQQQEHLQQVHSRQLEEQLKQQHQQKLQQQRLLTSPSTPPQYGYLGSNSLSPSRAMISSPTQTEVMGTDITADSLYQVVACHERIIEKQVNQIQRLQDDIKTLSVDKRQQRHQQRNSALTWEQSVRLGRCVALQPTWETEDTEL